MLPSAEWLCLLKQGWGEGVRIGPEARSKGSSARVRPLVDLEEMRAVHLRIDLRGGEARMPQQLLDGAQIRTRAQKMGGEGVAERMRGGRLWQPKRAAGPRDGEL